MPIAFTTSFYDLFKLRISEKSLHTIQNVRPPGSDFVGIAIGLCLPVCLIANNLITPALSAYPTKLLLLPLFADVLKTKDAN